MVSGRLYFSLINFFPHFIWLKQWLFYPLKKKQNNDNNDDDDKQQQQQQSYVVLFSEELV